MQCARWLAGWLIVIPRPTDRGSITSFRGPRLDGRAELVARASKRRGKVEWLAAGGASVVMMEGTLGVVQLHRE